MTDPLPSAGPNGLDKLPLDPAWIAIGLAGIVMVGAGLSMRGGGGEPAPLAAPPAPPAVVAVVPAVPLAAPPPAVAALPAPAPPAPGREAELEARIAQREAELGAIAQRLAMLEQAVPRIAAAEARVERLQAIEAVRAQLERGQPLGPVLARLGAAVPAGLAAYAASAPPTEAGLRLAFDDAVRAARGQAAANRPTGLGSVMTLRRGDEVLWGDANEAHVMRARRALEAGDLAGALAQLERLDTAYRAALAGWMGQAAGLAAARAALRDLAGG